jgi:RNase P subunit RPR2
MDCRHENIMEYTDWIYCADCDDIIMTNIACEHQRIENRNGWVHCTVCGEIVGYYGVHTSNTRVMSATCAHINLRNQGFWVRCADCGAARFGKHEPWIMSSVKLAYLDLVAKNYDASIPPRRCQPFIN